MEWGWVFILGYFSIWVIFEFKYFFMWVIFHSKVASMIFGKTPPKAMEWG